MAEPFHRSANAASSGLPSGGSLRLGRQFLMMFRALLALPQRNKILFLDIALTAVIGATAFAQVKLNVWNQPFYDALSRKDLGAFFSQLVVFVYIACGFLILKLAETWFRRVSIHCQRRRSICTHQDGFNLSFGEFKQKDEKKLHGRLQPE